MVKKNSWFGALPVYNHNDWCEATRCALGLSEYLLGQNWSGMTDYHSSPQVYSGTNKMSPRVVLVTAVPQ